MMTFSILSELGLVTSQSVVRSGHARAVAAGTSPRGRSSRQRATVRRS
jgi:hypothetical protein